MAEYQMKKTSWWYEAIVDWELRNPGLYRAECARELNCSESHLSVISNSDSFKEFREMRMVQHRTQVSETIINRLEVVTDKALGKLEGVIDAAGPMTKMTDVSDVAKMGLQALGMFRHGSSGLKGDTTNVQVNIGINPEDLAEARKRMKDANTRSDVVQDSNAGASTPTAEIELDQSNEYLLPAPAPV